MEPFTRITGRAAALLRPNIDTDAIIPSREMKQVSKTGLSAGLFANWRYTDVDARVENPEFVLNQPRGRDAVILLGGENFGCGSSREHAVWALHEYGVRAILAPSFGAIFQGNCVRNGLLPASLTAAEVEALAEALRQAHEPVLTVDLGSRQVRDPTGRTYAFAIAPADREMLLEGLDPIGVTLKLMDQIRAFETSCRPVSPWLFRKPTTRGAA